MNYFMRRLCTVALFGSVSLMIGQACAQADVIPFSILGGGVTATGTLSGSYETLSGFAGTVFVATGASGTYSDATDGISGTITNVLAGQTYTSIPSNSNHDSIAANGLIPFPPASYDNILYPNGDSPVVCDPTFYPYHGGQMDIYGLMLKLQLQGGGTGLVNVWSNGILNNPANPIGLDYGVSDGLLGTAADGSPLYTVKAYLGNSNNYPSYSPSGIHFSSVPELSSVIGLGLGIAALPLLRLRRKKRA